MTKQCVFQLRRNVLRNYAGKCQGLIASVIQNLSQCRSAHHIPHGLPWDRPRVSAAATTRVHTIHARAHLFHL